MSTTIACEGNVTRDPEMRYADSGMAVLRFGIAVNERKKVDGEWTDGDPSFYNVTAFGALAENSAEQLSKGARVVVAGRLELRPYEAKDGSKAVSADVVADSVGISTRFAPKGTRPDAGDLESF